MTKAATRFVSPLTFEALTEKPVAVELFEADPTQPFTHLELARRAEIVVVAPTSADFMARAAAGRAEDLLSCVLLATRAPVLLAPAMNPAMWAHPMTQHNARVLVERADYQIVGPALGQAACGDEGPGRMAEPQVILEAASRLMGTDLVGTSIVITAGPTQEIIDPVRYLSNRSSGKMGYALAAACARRGGEVSLISGPVGLEPPPGVEVIPVVTAAQMQHEVEARAKACHALIMAAAVADYRPARAESTKMKRSAEPMTLDLVPNPDILAAVVQARGGPSPLVVGFALETEDLLARARAKLERKGCDLLVANLAGTSIGREDSVALILDRDGILDEPGQVPKSVLADRILDQIVSRLD